MIKEIIKLHLIFINSAFFLPKKIKANNQTTVVQSCTILHIVILQMEI